MTVQTSAPAAGPSRVAEPAAVIAGASSVVRELNASFDAAVRAVRDVEEVGAEKLGGLALVPHIPAPASFAATDADQVGARVKPPLSWLVRQLQAALPALVRPASVVILLPTGAAMGERDAALSSAVCGGAMSMARTWAIELQRDDVAVNCLMYEMAGGELVHPAALAAQLRALWSAPAITGQEIFTGSGTHLGRLRP